MALVHSPGIAKENTLNGVIQHIGDLLMVGQNHFQPHCLQALVGRRAHAAAYQDIAV